MGVLTKIQDLKIGIDARNRSRNRSVKFHPIKICEHCKLAGERKPAKKTQTPRQRNKIKWHGPIGKFVLQKQIPKTVGTIDEMISKRLLDSRSAENLLRCLQA